MFPPASILETIFEKELALETETLCFLANNEKIFANMNKFYRKHLLYLARFVSSFVSNRIGNMILRLKDTGLTAKAILPVHQHKHNAH